MSPVLENYHRNAGDQLPAFLVDQIQEMLAALSPNLRLTQPTLTSLRLAAATGNQGRQGATVSGLWRYIDVDVDATHPGGTAGTYNIWVVCSANAIDGSYNDTTDYQIYPQILATASTPSGNTPAAKPIVAYRLIGQCEWDGANITGYWQYVGTTDSTMPIKPTAPSTQGWAIKAMASAGQVGSFVIFQTSTAAHVFDMTTAAATFGVPLTTTGLTVNGASTINGDMTVSDAKNIVLGTTTGSKIGTAAAQKLGFWGSTPVVRVAGATQPVLNVATNTTGGFPSPLTAASTLNDVIATLSRIVNVLESYGLLGTGGWSI